MSGRRPAPGIVAAALAVLAVLPFLGTLGHELLRFDDRTYLFGDPRLADGITLANLRWAATTFTFSNWHPLTWISYMVDVELWGFSPAGLRGSNLVLHGATAAFLFLFWRRTTGATWRPAVAVAIWAVHPQRVESVVWIAERKDVLSGLLFALTLWSWAGWVERRGRERYLATLGVFALGLAAKGMLVTLPALLLLLDGWPFRRAPGACAGGAPAMPSRERSWGWLLAEKVPFVGLAGGAGILTWLAQSGARDLPGLSTWSLGGRAAVALAAVADYLASALWPAALAVYYPLPPEVPWGRAIVGASALLAAGVAGVATWRSRPWILVGFGWFVGMLAPVSGLVAISAAARADRYTYLPSIGLAVAIVWTAAGLAGTSRRRRAAAALAAIATVAALAAATVGYAASWRDGVTLFRRTIAIGGESFVAEASLGGELLARGRATEAIPHLERARQLAGDSVEVETNLGLALRAVGRREAAREAFRRALRIDPGRARTHFHLAIAEEELGNPLAAVRHLAFAATLDPGLESAWSGLAALIPARVPPATALEALRPWLERSPPPTFAAIGATLADAAGEPRLEAPGGSLVPSAAAGPGLARLRAALSPGTAGPGGE